MWLDWLVFCDCDLQSVCPLMEKYKMLMEAPDGIDWLKGKLGLLMGRAMLNKALIQFSIDGWSCVPCLLFTWGQTMVKVMKIMVTSLKRSHSCTATFSVPNPAAGHHRPMPPLETPGHRQVCDSLLWGHCSFAPFCWVLVYKVLLHPPRVYFPVWCKLWQLYGGVNGDLLQEGLCHTQVCCTQSPYPCGRPPCDIYITVWYIYHDIYDIYITYIYDTLWIILCFPYFNF